MTNQFRVWVWVLILGAGILAAGCDKTADEFHQQKVQENLALYQSVSGTYRGTLSINGGESAQIEIDLTPVVTSTESADGTSNAGKVIMQGHVTIDGVTASSAPIQNGYYSSSNNSTDGQFSGSVPVTLSTGATVNMTISASISNGNTISGTIQPDSVSMTGSFTATRDAPFGAGQADTSGASTEGSVVTYTGSYQDTICLDQTTGLPTPNSVSGRGNGNTSTPTCDVDVTMVTQVLRPAEGQDFYNNFSVERLIQIQIVTGETVTAPDGQQMRIFTDPITISPAGWNIQTGYIEADATNSTNISCRKISPAKPDLLCDYIAVGRHHQFVATPTTATSKKK